MIEMQMIEKVCELFINKKKNDVECPNNSNCNKCPILKYDVFLAKNHVAQHLVSCYDIYKYATKRNKILEIKKLVNKI